MTHLRTWSTAQGRHSMCVNVIAEPSSDKKSICSVQRQEVEGLALEPKPRPAFLFS